MTLYPPWWMHPQAIRTGLMDILGTSNPRSNFDSMWDSHTSAFLTLIFSGLPCNMLNFKSMYYGVIKFDALVGWESLSKVYYSFTYFVISVKK